MLHCNGCPVRKWKDYYTDGFGAPSIRLRHRLPQMNSNADALSRWKHTDVEIAHAAITCIHWRKCALHNKVTQSRSRSVRPCRNLIIGRGLKRDHTYYVDMTNYGLNSLLWMGLFTVDMPCTLQDLATVSVLPQPAFMNWRYDIPSVSAFLHVEMRIAISGPPHHPPPTTHHPPPTSLFWYSPENYLHSICISRK